MKAGKILYDFGISFYSALAKLVSPIDPKARKMLKGQSQAYVALRNRVDSTARYIWVHAASLGEFEQARPVIQYIKEYAPEYKILLTFFSSSGFEAKKNYKLADIICYMPLDKPKNVKKFLSLIQPEKTIFIKYEYWYNYTEQLTKMGCETYVVAAKFRKNQYFFHWYGAFMRPLLRMFTQICVQDKESIELLAKYKINNAVVTGDTRFDRVVEIKNTPYKNDILESFTAKRNQYPNEQIIIAGSTWATDDDIVIPCFNSDLHTRLIIAPHEITEKHIKYIEDLVKRPSIRYSQATAQNVGAYDCLIIDTIGILSYIYRFSTIAYVGGGFGKGIHNVLEAAVYGIPVIFGKKFRKFKEAKDLINIGGGFSINNLRDYHVLINEFCDSEDSLEIAGSNALKYVEDNVGAVDRTMKVILDN